MFAKLTESDIWIFVSFLTIFLFNLSFVNLNKPVLSLIFYKPSLSRPGHYSHHGLNFVLTLNHIDDIQIFFVLLNRTFSNLSNFGSSCKPQRQAAFLNFLPRFELFVDFILIVIFFYIFWIFRRFTPIVYFCSKLPINYVLFYVARPQHFN